MQKIDHPSVHLLRDICLLRGQRDSKLLGKVYFRYPKELWLKILTHKVNC